MTIVLNGTTGIQNVLGSAAAPAESNTTSSNTGLYFPTSTTLGLSTAGTNAVYIDASQKVGIGITSPAATLDVVGNIKLNNVLAIRNNTGASFPTGYGWEIYNADATTNYLQSYNRTGTAFMNSVYNALSHQFYSSGSETVRIDSSGNVGIGTSSNATNVKLQVASPTNTVTNSRGNAYIYTTEAAGIDKGAQLTLGGQWTSGEVPFASIAGRAEAAAGAVQGYMQFGTINSSGVLAERMRISSAGNLGINNTSPTQKLSVSGSLNATAGNQIIAGATAVYGDGSIGTPSLQWNAFTGVASGAVSIADGTGSLGSIIFRNPNGQVGNIATSGSATSYNTSSDYRLKENIAPMVGALAVVNQLKPCTYNWKVDGSSGQGFIAHELQAVVPDCVSGEKDEVSADGSPKHQGIDTSFLVATLTAAIQEQQALITSLTARITALEAR